MSLIAATRTSPRSRARPSSRRKCARPLDPTPIMPTLIRSLAPITRDAAGAAAKAGAAAAPTRNTRLQELAERMNDLQRQLSRPERVETLAATLRTIPLPKSNEFRSASRRANSDDPEPATKTGTGFDTVPLKRRNLQSHSDTAHVAAKERDHSGNRGIAPG